MLHFNVEKENRIVNCHCAENSTVTSHQSDKSQREMKLNYFSKPLSKITHELIKCCFALE